MTQSPLSFKAVLMGDSGVGKTSIVTRWVTGVHQKLASPTVGANHHRKRVLVEGRDVDLFIWDTAGQEQFQSLTPLYARDACVAIVTTSVIDTVSFDNIERWVDILSSAADEMPPIVLAVNKIDLLDDATLTQEAIETKYSGKFTGLFFCSAVTNEGIENLFLMAAKAGYRFAMSKRATAESILNQREQSQKKCC
jgi:small GTP-binding protein